MWKFGIAIGTAALIQTALAQVATNVTCNADSAWMANSKGQNPCLVSAYLSSVCNSNAWTVPTIVGQGPYNPPNQSGVSDCRCNTVVYSLLSACSTCQGGVVGSWADWITYCPSNYVNKYYPHIVPSQTDVPGWANLDPTAVGIWSASAAQQYATSNSTGNPSVTLAPGATATSAPSSGNSGGKKTNVGAIVGGVIGGIALLAALGFLIWFLFRRSSYGKGQKVTPAPYTDANLGDTEYPQADQGYEKQGYPPHRLDMGTPAPLMGGHGAPMKPYDPSDPSTFPNSPGYGPASPAPGSTVVGHDTGVNSSSYQSYPSHQQGYQPHQQHQYQPGAYSGAAEV